MLIVQPPGRATRDRSNGGARRGSASARSWIESPRERTRADESRGDPARADDEDDEADEKGVRERAGPFVTVAKPALWC
jgi:hypothetical protein